ncbi:MAG: TatD family hydrolase [Gammaproteobacteria bacterium]
MQLVDIGANLTHESFAPDLAEVIAQARQASVAHIMLTGTDLASSRAALDLAARHPDYFRTTVGFHPHIAGEVSAEDLLAAAKLAREQYVVAVGETGLDYNRNFSPKAEQIRVFERHLELAAELNKPVFLHQRDAHADFLPILKAHRAGLPGGVVHCFTDTRAALDDYLALDMHIGITGWICDERRGLDLQETVQAIPLDRLLIETDAPYLLPRTIRPKPKTRRNEPRYLPAVLDKIAECRQESVTELAAATTANASKLFNLTLNSSP